MAQRRLRIVTWNCNGALRRKWPALERFDADVLTIQECEDPAQSADAAYRAWAGDYLWTGTDKNKGLGVFYHIDHVFAAQAWRVQGLEIGAADEWLALSDHMPILAAVGE